MNATNIPNACQGLSATATAARNDHTTNALNRLESVTKRIVGEINALEERLDSVIVPQDQPPDQPTPSDPSVPHLPMQIDAAADTLDRASRKLESILGRIELPPCRPQVTPSQALGNAAPIFATDYRAYQGSR